VKQLRSCDGAPVRGSHTSMPANSKGVDLCNAPQPMVCLVCMFGLVSNAPCLWHHTRAAVALLCLLSAAEEQGFKSMYPHQGAWGFWNLPGD
jgi:hypothetical protein